MVDVVALTGELLSTIELHASRELAGAIHKIDPYEFFPDGVADDASGDLQKAAVQIGDALAAGKGEISVKEMHAAVENFHAQSGTPLCPPILAALAALLG